MSSDHSTTCVTREKPARLGVSRVAHASAIMLGLVVVGCSPMPTMRPPGDCATESEFMFVGTTTLADLNLGNVPSDDPDLSRPGRFWVTRRFLQFDPPPGTPRLPATRILCVRWLDGLDDRHLQVVVPDDWRPPG